MKQPVSVATAFAVAALGILSFTCMDALMKRATLDLGTYNALFWRGLAGVTLAGSVFFLTRAPMPTRPALKVHLIRGSVGALMALTWFWGLARLPMAQALALSFIAPLIALYLAALLLKERIEARSILAGGMGLAGVLIILSGQIRTPSGPEALAGVGAIFVSACLYAYNIVLMRQQALVAKPVEIAFCINLITTGWFLIAAPVLAVPPPLASLPDLIGSAILAYLSLLLLAWAYARAQAQHLAPVEYTGFIWAVLLGWLVFGETVSLATIIGAGVIITACLIATRRRAVAPGPATS